MVVSFGNSGQFGNALLSTAHFVASAAENGYSFRSLGIARFRSVLQETAVEEYVLRGFWWSVARRVGCAAASRLLRRELISFRGRLTLVSEISGRFPIGPEEIAEAARRGTVVHFGWLFRDYESLKRRLLETRSTLRLADIVTQQAAGRLHGLKGSATLVIGVHVRRGDYVRFRQGQFYFEDEVYLRIATEAAKSLAGAGGDVVIVGVSAGTLCWPREIGIFRVRTTSGDFKTDVALLSMCDAILGPPSTFSAAASFLGGKPLYVIRSARDHYSRERAVPYPLQSINV